MLDAVMADARASGLRVGRSRVTKHSWEVLLASTHLSLANERHLEMLDDAVDEREGEGGRATAPLRPPHPSTND